MTPGCETECGVLLGAPVRLSIWRRTRLFWIGAVVLLFFAVPANAHVGSPDIFFEGNAGPYRLFVTVRMPQVIPGIADIEIRSESNDVSEIRIAPMQLTGPGSQYAPTPDVTKRSKADPQFFTGSLWLMELGSLQVHVQADGSRGPAELSVPVPAVAQRTLPMQRWLGILLFSLLLVLAFAMVSIAAAAVREGSLEWGALPSARALRRSRVAMGVASLIVFAVLFAGAEWWKSDANQYAGRVYNPPAITATIEDGDRLILREGAARIAAGNPQRRGTTSSLNDLIPDHGHLMHLFLIRMPAMDSFWHLHPDRIGRQEFAVDLPSIPAGHYDIFADVVLSTGFPVTMVGQMDVSAISGKALSGDNSGASPDALSHGTTETTAALPDGGRMIWLREAGPLKSNVPISFHFRVENSDRRPASDLEPYMGMAAHAEIVRSDGSVFAHVHPVGSVSMAALELAQTGGAADMAGMAMAGMQMPGSQVPINAPERIDPEISFPYGLPQPGLYRIFVQIKRAGRIETGVFDAKVE